MPINKSFCFRNVDGFKGDTVMRFIIKMIPASIFLVAISFPAFSQMYKWKDKDGNLILSTTPPPPNVQYEQKKMGGSRQSDSPGRKTDSNASKDVNIVRENKDIKVIIYMADWCPACREAIEYLNSLNVNLTQYDIYKDPEKKEEYRLKRKEWNFIPLIDIEGIILRGGDESPIINALNERRRVGARY
jgi:glutaredoxin